MDYYKCAGPSHNPWGTRQESIQKEIAPGIWWIETPSHGGFYLSPQRRQAFTTEELHATFNHQGWQGFFEEDCDARLVAERFPDEVNPRTVEGST